MSIGRTHITIQEGDEEEECESFISRKKGRGISSKIEILVKSMSEMERKIQKHDQVISVLNEDIKILKSEISSWEVQEK